jgi:hypothetical protein
VSASSMAAGLTPPSLQRTHEQMAAEPRGPGALWPSSLTNDILDDPSSSLDSTPPQRRPFPRMQPFRFPGDGLDYRRPSMSQPTDPGTTVIDLTDDPEPAQEQDASGNGPAPPRRRAAHAPRYPHEIIDLEELEEQRSEATARQGSPEVELLYSNPIRHSTPALLHPPTMPSMGFWYNSPLGQQPQNPGMLQGFAHTFISLANVFQHRHPHGNGPRLDVPINAGRERQEEHARHHAGVRTTLFQMPNPDYERQGFPLGQPATHDQLENHDPLPQARPGFTRTPGEGDILICANCDSELGEGDTEERRQVWVIKICGHV